jgi:outer membrane PBP1 activator LpoA protein
MNSQSSYQQQRAQDPHSTTRPGTFEASPGATESRRHFSTAANAITSMYQAQRQIYSDGVTDTLARVRDLLTTAASRNQLNGYIHLEQILPALRSLEPPPATNPALKDWQTGNPRKRHAEGRPEDRHSLDQELYGDSGPVYNDVEFDRSEYPPEAHRPRYE